jgi:hypothetical protein
MSVGKRKPSPVLTNEEYQKLFDTHIKVDEETGCYLWTAAKNNIGYGMFRYKRGMATAHRSQMEMLGHDIQGKMVYHTCNSYDCVNPEHLRVGTIMDKSKSMTDKGHSGKTFTDPKYLKECPHCKKLANPAVYGHSHGDRCKLKPKV